MGRVVQLRPAQWGQDVGHLQVFQGRIVHVHPADPGVLKIHEGRSGLHLVLIIIIHWDVGLLVELGTVVRIGNVGWLECAMSGGVIERFRQRWLLKLHVTLGSKVSSRDNPIVKAQRWLRHDGMVAMVKS